MRGHRSLQLQSLARNPRGIGGRKRDKGGKQLRDAEPLTT
jgi:hypothetical protein